MSNIEFIVGRVTHEDGFALVDGRVGDGTIRVHDTFTAICSYDGQRVGDRVDVVRGQAEPVRLTVETIEAYRHFLDCVERGLTARLRVRGDGLERLADQKILSL
jgi:hypothetical protein